jgi:hypothetical protein
MNIFKILLGVIVGVMASGPSFASPPLAVGDSFLVLETQSTLGGGSLTSNEVVYLGKQGVAQLLTLSVFDVNLGQTTYQPSTAGTYTYVPTPGNPNEATLTLNFDGADPLVLEFAGDTTGTVYYASNNFTGPHANSQFTLLLASPNTFLANVSNRVSLRPADTAISGFVIQGSAPRLVLIRCVGPTLANFGVSPTSTHPRLALFSGTGSDQIGTGQIWDNLPDYDAQAMAWIFGFVGAFPLKAGSNDVAFFGLLSPGDYTAQAFDSTAAATGGSALTEVYILPYSG